jgi:hypothetical protein
LSAIEFKYDVPLEQTMAFEPVYHEAMRLDILEKTEIWNAFGSIFAWMYVDGVLVGETYGVPLTSHCELIEELGTLTETEKKCGIYCYSNTILPAFQNRGLGSILKVHWLGLAVGNGFDVVYGHARPGGSQALNAKFGAVFMNSFPDWGGSGEEYKMYRLVLK